MDNKTSMDPRVPHTDFDELRRVANESVDIAKRKDAEYGASWCKRGGVGAFFTVWRKTDRLETQLKSVGYDMFDMTVDPNETESLDETMKDLANYLYLVMEKRRAIYKLAQTDLIDDQLAHKLPDDATHLPYKYSVGKISADSLKPEVTSSWATSTITSEETALADHTGEDPVVAHSGALEATPDVADDTTSVFEKAIANLSRGIHTDISSDMKKLLSGIKVDDFKIVVTDIKNDGSTTFQVSKDGITNSITVQGNNIPATIPEASPDTRINYDGIIAVSKEDYAKAFETANKRPLNPPKNIYEIGPAITDRYTTDSEGFLPAISAGGCTIRVNNAKTGESTVLRVTKNGVTNNIEIQGSKLVVNGSTVPSDEEPQIRLAELGPSKEELHINMVDGDVLTVFRKGVMLNSFHGKGHLVISQDRGRFVADCHGNISISDGASISVGKVASTYSSSDGYLKLIGQIQEAQIDAVDKDVLIKQVQAMYETEFSIEDEGVPTAAYVNQ